MVNPNGLDPPRRLQKVVIPNGLDPPDRLKLRGKLDLTATEGITGMQNQKIASGGEQFIICTGVRNVQGQEVVPAYTIRADVGNVSVDAIVDTAAEITVISEEVYRRLIPKPRLSGKRRVQMAGKGQASWANLVGPVSVKVGPLSTQETIYVAQINDDMLLGVDYLDKYNAVIDFEDHTLQVQGEQIPLRTLVSDMRSKAYLKQGCLIPPMTVRRVGCQINTPLAGTISVEPRNDHDLVIPWVICKDQDSIVTVLCNWTTREVTVPENTCVGTAYELSGDALNQETEDVHKRNPAIRSCQATSDLPAYLESLWSDSKAELDDQQAEFLRNLLEEYQDVFAKSYFDLGDFTAVYHIGDDMDRKDTPTTRGLGRMG
ncbi:DNA damage-inducible protein 1 [Plakobranchus ocellatus]|uniref:DNA damage-inducible protein 1 n=1 Tax=Plakobranchus ocellatus TaxID=259542 RepID=A0AAV3Z1J7_9GAST|nr:DNA damage-inducible protein 1 [Plakobranchus ocellatus]